MSIVFARLPSHTSTQSKAHSKNNKLIALDIIHCDSEMIKSEANKRESERVRDTRYTNKTKTAKITKSEMALNIDVEITLILIIIVDSRLPHHLPAHERV